MTIKAAFLRLLFVCIASSGISFSVSAQAEPEDIFLALNVVGPGQVQLGESVDFPVTFQAGANHVGSATYAISFPGAALSSANLEVLSTTGSGVVCSIVTPGQDAQVVLEINAGNPSANVPQSGGCLIRFTPDQTGDLLISPSVLACRVTIVGIPPIVTQCLFNQGASQQTITVTAPTGGVVPESIPSLTPASLALLFLMLALMGSILTRGRSS